jgi:hypothetical protein
VVYSAQGAVGLVGAALVVSDVGSSDQRHFGKVIQGSQKKEIGENVALVGTARGVGLSAPGEEIGENLGTEEIWGVVESVELEVGVVIGVIALAFAISPVGVVPW